MEKFTPTRRTQLHRLPKRAAYDREIVYRILDEALVCHVGLVVRRHPLVIPTGFGRKDDTLYLHGSTASHMLREASKGIPVCVTVTLLDGLVLARSAFHHSLNYRSVVIFGTAHTVTSKEEKLDALRIFTNHIIPNRWDDVRPPSVQELKATAVLALPLREVSAKIRSGPPGDEEEDYALPIWAGIVPLTLSAGAPIADAKLRFAIQPPRYAQGYRR